MAEHSKSWKDPYEGLNPEQREVVTWNEGILRVCAVAGSGKTRSMVSRIARMVNEGYDPQQILAVTFTRKAAQEMEDRLIELGCPLARRDGKGARVGTFHSLGLEIIRDGSPWEDFVVDDSNEMRRILKHRIVGYCMENGVQIGMNWRDVDLTDVEQWIGHNQNELKAPGELQHAYDRRFDEAYGQWEEERHARGILTFDSMMYLSNQYLLEDEPARGRWASKYKHVMIDEYQDTNLAQKVMVDTLAVEAESFMIVGDDDQSIYEWRGAKPKFMIEFEKTYPSVHSVTLSTNYRSVPEVIAAGNAVIQCNQERIAKQALSNRVSEGHPVVVEPVTNMDAEAESVLAHIRELMVDGCNYRDFTIMYRTNAQSRAFEEVFLSEEIPYEVVGGQDFYKRKEISDVLAYLRIIAGQDHGNPVGSAKRRKKEAVKWPSCRRAVNTPFRFIGKVSIEKLVEAAETNGCTLFEACDEFGDNVGLQSRQVRTLQAFVAAVNKARSMDMRTEAPLSDVISTLLADIEYISWIERDQGSDTSENSRVSNVRELIRTANRFPNAASFLTYIAKMDKEKKKKVDGKKVGNLVQLMSIHKSKGLEFPVVFLAGTCEDILPHARSENPEEERRLFYVACTRAKNRLFIMVPQSAWIGSKLKPLRPSRFISEAGVGSAGPSADTSDVI